MHRPEPLSKQVWVWVWVSTTCTRACQSTAPHRNRSPASQPASQPFWSVVLHRGPNSQTDRFLSTVASSGCQRRVRELAKSLTACSRQIQLQPVQSVQSALVKARQADGGAVATRAASNKQQATSSKQRPANTTTDCPTARPPDRHDSGPAQSSSAHQPRPHSTLSTPGDRRKACARVCVCVRE